MVRRAAAYGLVFAPPPPGRPLREGEDYVAPPSRRAHGTRAKYVVEKCRCPACRADNTRYARERDRALRRPDGSGPAYVSAGPVVEHLRWLQSRGMGLRQVAQVAGVSRSSLTDLVNGRQNGMRPTTRDRLMAVRVADVASGALVPAAPTWGRVEELLRRGYSKRWIALQLGARGRQPSLRLGRRRVRASTARAVEALVHIVEASGGGAR